jgi:hypothetical protein
MATLFLLIVGPVVVDVYYTIWLQMSQKVELLLLSYCNKTFFKSTIFVHFWRPIIIQGPDGDRGRGVYFF